MNDPERIDSVTVWRVRLGRETVQNDVKGELSIEGADLRFVEEGGSWHRISMAHVRKVKRLVGSPVVLVEHDDGEHGVARTAFYFTKPPPLTLTTRRGVESKRKARRVGAHYLGTSNTARKDDIRAWVARIRAAMPEG